ncbi:hypothetical protein K7432_001767 [Basidiobolus ranarum]|uniref:Amino acid transporter transmembrane domain-containing protein n=1 Tax=Basidiobolus ranarum TaxID=34480 RepID=A0ABR2W8Z2_9FUNG
MTSFDDAKGHELSVCDGSKAIPEDQDEEHSRRTGSSFGAYFNVICVIAAVIAVYSGHLLVKCLYYNRVSRLKSYPCIGEAAFGRVGRVVVQIFHFSILLGTSCIYIMLTGLNTQTLLKQYGVDMNLKILITIAAVIAWIPFILLKTLKEVAILSVFGVIATAIVIIVSAVVGLLDLPNNLHQTHHFVVPAGLPVALASISFSFGGNVIYAHVEGTMRHPKSWTRILGLAVLTILLMYIVIGIPGYYVYGENTKSPILDNLPEGAATTVAIIMITLHVLLAAPIMMTTFANEMEHSFKIDTKYLSKTKEFALRLALRTVITVVLAVVAMTIPFFGDFMSLIGALANCMTVFVLPIVFYIKLYGFRTIRIWELLWCFLVVVIGLIGCVLGATDAIQSLKRHFEEA